MTADLAAIYRLLATDSSRRQMESAGAPTVDAPSVAGTGGGAVSDAFCASMFSFSESLVLPATIGLFGIVSQA